MPTDRKKVAENRICNGRTSPRAWALWRLSDTTRPARNAPSEPFEQEGRAQLGDNPVEPLGVGGHDLAR
jgi:hypothetical protein